MHGIDICWNGNTDEYYLDTSRTVIPFVTKISTLKVNDYL